MLVVTSTQIAPAGQELTWLQALRRSTLSWTVWALLTPLIIKVDRWLPVSRGSLLERFALHIPLSLLFTTLKQLLVAGVIALFVKSGPELAIDSLRASLKGTFQASVLAYWVVIFVYITFDYHKHLKEQEIRTAELKRLASQSRLETLRAQLHPHFLFNALNTISAHVERNPVSSRRMLEELEELLRLSLAHSEDREVPLAQEIAFVEHYLAIQKARFQDRLAAMVKVDSDVLQALVPTFILQPLVENAVLYGMPARLEKGTVEVRAWRTNGQLHLTVQDDGPGLPQGWDPEHSVGIGISNTRERLRQLYGDRDQTFEILSEPGQGVRVELSLPFRQSAATS
ncbi:MAG TPA: histidine kinase [Bryobacteraceae bacterium]|nr:histidine kinase [Bryobacteraceae bacterium]